MAGEKDFPDIRVRDILELGVIFPKGRGVISTVSFTEKMLKDIINDENEERAKTNLEILSKEPAFNRIIEQETKEKLNEVLLPDPLIGKKIRSTGETITYVVGLTISIGSRELQGVMTDTNRTILVDRFLLRGDEAQQVKVLTRNTRDRISAFIEIITIGEKYYCQTIVNEKGGLIVDLDTYDDDEFTAPEILGVGFMASIKQLSPMLYSVVDTKGKEHQISIMTAVIL